MTGLVITICAILVIWLLRVLAMGSNPLDNDQIGRLAIRRLSLKPWDLPLDRLRQSLEKPFSEVQILEAAEIRCQKSKIESLQPIHTSEHFEKSFAALIASKRGMFTVPPTIISKFSYFVASFLKGRKYEWIIIAFAKNQNVSRFWINRGIDNKSAMIGLNPEEITQLARKYGTKSIAIYHNHPISSSIRRSLSYDDFKRLHFKMSDADIFSSSLYHETLNSYGLDFAGYICVAGEVKLVCCSFAKDENSVAQYVDLIKSEIEQRKKDFQKEVENLALSNKGIWCIYRLKSELRW